MRTLIATRHLITVDNNVILKRYFPSNLLGLSVMDILILVSRMIHDYHLRH